MFLGTNRVIGGRTARTLDEKAVDTLLLEGRLDRDVNDKTSRLVVYG
jgi:hypothetical protein